MEPSGFVPSVSTTAPTETRKTTALTSRRISQSHHISLNQTTQHCRRSSSISSIFRSSSSSRHWILLLVLTWRAATIAPYSCWKTPSPHQSNNHRTDLSATASSSNSALKRPLHFPPFLPTEAVDTFSSLSTPSIPTKQTTDSATKHSLGHNHNNNNDNNQDEDEKKPFRNEEGYVELEDDESFLSLPHSLLLQMALTEEDQKFVDRIQSSLNTTRQWEGLSLSLSPLESKDQEEYIRLLQECRAQIPWEELRNPHGPYSNPDEDRWLQDNANALFLQRLCRWFPKDFMSWVNVPPCTVCGSKNCEMKTVRGAETQEEQDGHAKRVEVYYCPECKYNTTFFPRYNKASKLLETRKGRCGEYSNLFGVFCKAVGLEVRLVLDLSDHLWTEIKLTNNQWIMADACEGVIDKASMYEQGWGKQGLSYMLAISPIHGVLDVTPKYTREYWTEDFQTRRRSHTTSEEMSQHLLDRINQQLVQKKQQASGNNNTILIDEWNSQLQSEQRELQQFKQATEWTAHETYGRGRISGSLAWKQARQESGKVKSEKEKEEAAVEVTVTKASGEAATKEGNETKAEKKEIPLEVAGFEIESFAPPTRGGSTSLKVYPKPTTRHNGIMVGDTPCAVGETDSISIVVVDEAHFGCILQTQSFLSWKEVNEFIEGLPTERIVLLNGIMNSNYTKVANRTDDAVKLPRLGGWNGTGVLEHGAVFIGQVDANPDWMFCETLSSCNDQGHEVKLSVPSPSDAPPLKLRTEMHTIPQNVVGRLPESVMPLQTQLLASEEQKRIAFTSFCATNGRYCGYTTKPQAPVYLFDSSAFPLQKLACASTTKSTWNTLQYLPPPLVPKDDIGVSDGGSDVPKVDVPIESSFFSQALGSSLLTSATSTTILPTSEALHNSRLVGLYFSAHWCGPCRQFTPLLSSAYEVLKEYRPTHGLEIVFVSGDRDHQSFESYFSSMPWLSIPFQNLSALKQQLNMTYGVRGIPSFVVLDSVTGRVVVNASESRNQIAMACRGGEDSIERLLDTWISKTPQETQEIISMLEMSCLETKSDVEPVRDADNPYLLRKRTTYDPTYRIKQFFEELVKDGSDPTSAAAKAIGLVAEEQKSGIRLPAGPLDGKATRIGVPSSSDALSEAFARCIEWNTPEAVAEVLQTALKYLKNATKQPWSAKFRTFKLSNKVADRITRVEGGLALLQCIGLEVFSTANDFKAIIPVGLDLEAAKETISKLLEGVEDPVVE